MWILAATDQKKVLRNTTRLVNKTKKKNISVSGSVFTSGKEVEREVMFSHVFSRVRGTPG